MNVRTLKIMNRKLESGIVLGQTIKLMHHPKAAFTVIKLVTMNGKEWVALRNQSTNKPFFVSKLLFLRSVIHIG